MEFGICATLDLAGAAKNAGADFIEAGAQPLLKGVVQDDQWTGLEEARRSPLPIRACNAMVPAELKITGPNADPGKLRQYMSRVCRRAGQCGVEILVFGSAGARNVPEGFDPQKVRPQLLDFLRTSAWLASEYNVTIVIEPLVRSESNIIHTIDDAMELIQLVNLPRIQCLVDSYHFWQNGDSLESLKRALPHIEHVHVADKDGRVAPGLSGSADYRPLFRVLKTGGYNRRISIEALNFDIVATGRKAMDYLRQQWQDA